MIDKDTDNLVVIDSLTFSHGERLIYDNISLSIPRGKITAILGPSGIGKTTLLRLIGGQLEPDAGHIWFDGQDVPNLGRRQLYQLRTRMSLLFQSGALFTELDVFDNVAFPVREHTRLPESVINTLVMMKLEQVGLRGASKLMPSELSGGMARRVALARATVLDPELIMYDEPFTGQDPISMGVLVSLIQDVNQNLGSTSVIVTHDVHEVLSIADYVYVMADKTVIAQGTPEQLQQDNSEQIQQFLQGKPDGPVPFHYPANALHDQLRELAG
ncbi:ATP-binding cassette domain-containing protein [Neiella marina]|uniref:ATP-binding cassette domain-containing protein n=1 Tax=Neiella holothuriorum TaxID=2870530 RepID=A0ABS7EAV3_9GAMM|nr:ATP-binding cassette domain-containing protein [Neiella holothuriorum]MBW8189474.1 ATP-binding cassette domain-containing protein [Neiella holothuriorum]